MKSDLVVGMVAVLFSVDLERLFHFPGIFNQKKLQSTTSSSIGKRFLAFFQRYGVN